jgi:hypothetical protein
MAGISIKSLAVPTNKLVKLALLLDLRWEKEIQEGENLFSSLSMVLTSPCKKSKNGEV